MTGTVTVNAPGEPRFDVLVFSRTTGFRHTDAIDAGKLAIPQMGEDGNYTVDLSEDPTKFTDAGLRPYEVVVFLNDDGEGILNADQRTAFERWTQRGGGIVAIHADANADRNWAWKGDMNGGAWFNNHPDGALQFQTATVNRTDDTHPATVNVPENWRREDEWYNFTAEPQNVHVLLKLDESTYVEQDGSDGVNDDHPIAWCSNYDGGRHFYTALGHKGSYWSEPSYLAHISGAIEWAAGEEEGDCGPERDGLPDRCFVRQGHDRRHDREPDGDRGRPRRQRLLRRARGPREVLQRRNEQRARHRADPGAPRQRERPARDHARPELQGQPLAVPLLQRADARGAAHLPLHASPPTARST